MKHHSTTLKGESVIHPLALSVINDSSHHEQRVDRFRAYSRRHYHAYLLGLVNQQATRERRESNTRWKPADIDTAVSEVHAYMEQHVAECVALHAARGEASVKLEAPPPP